MLNRFFRYMFFPFLLCLLTNIRVNGQGKNDTTVVITDTTNIDVLFKKARNLSYDGNYAQAKRILIKILEKKPNYYEVRTMLGRTYAWDKQYDMARTELSRVLIEKENDYEALSALYDVEFWTESYSVAADYLKVALGYYPTSEELLLKKAKLQIKLEEKDEAALTLRRILDLNPGNKEALRLMNSLEGRKLNNYIQLSYLSDLFSKNKASEQQSTAEYGHNFSFGQVIGRVLYADKFGHEGFAGEIESYPHITKSMYLDLLVGFSDTLGLFPRRKLMGEIYQKLPAGFEISAGVRNLTYKNTSNIYTVSLANYYKDYWFSVRAYITPRDSSDDVKSDKTSGTFQAAIRRYFGSSDNYLGIRAGMGTTPNEAQIADKQFTGNVLFYQTSSLGMQFQRRAFGNWIFRIEFTYSHENPAGSPYNRYSTLLTLKNVF
jgi:YaiO family outer membrane protein